MVTPALLTTNERIADERIKLAKQMSGRLHIDMLDGTLYDYHSLPPDSLEKLDLTPLAVELHCMVNDPVSIAQSGLPFDRIIMHYEIPGWEQAYSLLTTQGIDTWIALDPRTPIETLALPPDVSGVLILGVRPGQSGQPMLPDTHERVVAFKEYFPDTPLTVDGGINAGNVRDFISLGVDNVVLASALFTEKDPVAAYQNFVQISDPIGGMHDHKTA